MISELGAGSDGQLVIYTIAFVSLLDAIPQPNYLNASVKGNRVPVPNAMNMIFPLCRLGQSTEAYL